MKKNNNLKRIKDSINYVRVIAKYKSKCKKLNISPDFLSYLADNRNKKDTADILALIEKSNTPEQFKTNIFDYVSKNNNNYYNRVLLIGNLLGNYRFYSNWTWEWENSKVNKDNIQNFNYDSKDKIIPILEKQFYNYVMSDNEIKNKFYETVNNSTTKDYTSEISSEKIKQIFNRVVKGEIISDDDIKIAQIVHEYIYKIVNRYSLDDILNNYDFIIYDMQSSNNEDLNVKREKYNKNRHISPNLLVKIDNLQLLKDKLKLLDNEYSKNLLSRLNNLTDPENHLDEIEAIYSEYELLFREDLINHLFIPKEEEIIVSNYKDVKPQLIHCFIRNSEKFRTKLENQIIERIIEDRKNNNSSKELTDEEKQRYDNLLKRMEAELNQTQVNYSYDSKVGRYTDTNGFDRYISDTSNQISASVYSENYFNMRECEMIGIGFNTDGLLPDAIVLSSPQYLTTNKGLNNLEYDNKNEFPITSACYNELIKKDGKSEVVMFRRGIDFDTKASYVFVAFSRNNPRYQDLISEGRRLAKENNLKLVIYDTSKIKESYNNFLQESKELEYNSKETHHK